MRDVDQLISDLRGPDPPPRAPDWPAPRRRWPLVAVVGLGAAFAAWLVVARSADEAPTPRSAHVIERSVIDLRMVVERDGVAVRIASGSVLRVGERVWFRATAQPAIESILWVEGPAGRTQAWSGPLGPRPTDLGGADGLIAYRFDRPGRYEFVLSPGPPPPCADCTTRTFEVVP